MKRLLLALISVLALQAPAHGQQHIYTQPELDALLAPIALYPDGLITQILEAAKHPDQVAAAARLPKDAQPEESWDPNVKALLAFPEVLGRMAESPQWTADLGRAYASQQPHVLDTVQALRKRAQQNGQLQSNDQTTVTQDQGAIVVQPRNPEVVYVPYYDPYVVYGPWWWPAYTPVVWSPWVAYPVFVGVGFFWAHPVWHSHTVVVVDHFHGGPRPVAVYRPALAAPHNVVVRDWRRPAASYGHQWSGQQWNGHQWQPRGESRQGPSRPAPHTSMPAPTRYSDARPAAVTSRQGERGNDYRNGGGRNYGGARGDAAYTGRAHPGNSGGGRSSPAPAHHRG